MCSDLSCCYMSIYFHIYIYIYRNIYINIYACHQRDDYNYANHQRDDLVRGVIAHWGLQTLVVIGEEVSPQPVLKGTNFSGTLVGFWQIASGYEEERFQHFCSRSRIQSAQTACFSFNY